MCRNTQKDARQPKKSAKKKLDGDWNTLVTFIFHSFPTHSHDTHQPLFFSLYPLAQLAIINSLSFIMILSSNIPCNFSCMLTLPCHTFLSFNDTLLHTLSTTSTLAPSCSLHFLLLHTFLLHMQSFNTPIDIFLSTPHLKPFIFPLSLFCKRQRLL